MWCRSNAHLPASCGLERSTWCQTTVKRGLELSHRAIDSVLLKLPFRKRYTKKGNYQLRSLGRQRIYSIRRDLSVSACVQFLFSGQKTEGWKEYLPLPVFFSFGLTTWPVPASPSCLIESEGIGQSKMSKYYRRVDFGSAGLLLLRRCLIFFVCAQLKQAGFQLA